MSAQNATELFPQLTFNRYLIKLPQTYILIILSTLRFRIWGNFTFLNIMYFSLKVYRQIAPIYLIIVRKVTWNPVLWNFTTKV